MSLDRGLTGNFILGYHGCDKEVANRLVSGATFEESANFYDWLGDGIYFYEANPERALAFAEYKLKNPGKVNRKVNTASVVGAVISMNRCLDLTTDFGIKILQESYNAYKTECERDNVELPKNANLAGDFEKRLKVRALDREVFNHMTRSLDEDPDLQIDVVKAVFKDGGDAYPGAGILAKTHSHICVKNPNAIKGVFHYRF